MKMVGVSVCQKESKDYNPVGTCNSCTKSGKNLCGDGKKIFKLFYQYLYTYI